MDETKRLRSLVQWYSTQLQGITLQLAQTQVENAALKEQLQSQAERKAEEADAEVSAGPEAG